MYIVFGHFTKENTQMAHKHNKLKMYNIICLREIADSNSHKLTTSCLPKRLKFIRLTLTNDG